VRTDELVRSSAAEPPPLAVEAKSQTHFYQINGFYRTLLINKKVLLFELKMATKVKGFSCYIPTLRRLSKKFKL
jgi:hypothetical protein